MNTEKLYIKLLQNISFRTLAILSYILLFVTQRVPILKADEIELNDVTEHFSLSGIALGRLSKFFDYFAVEVPIGITALIVLAVILLAIGVIVLAFSLFNIKKLQRVSFCISSVGALLSVVFSIMLIVCSARLNSSDIGDIMVCEPHYVLMWLELLFFIIGTLFIYAYVKLPHYTLSEGMFTKALRAALDPRKFLRTFTSRDDTEVEFRTRVALKKKKYASISKPAALKKKRGKNVKHSESDLSRLELAVSKREHAERVANAGADVENSSLAKKPKRKKSKTAPKTAERPSANTNKAATALELAKRKAAHAEEVAKRKI